MFQFPIETPPGTELPPPTAFDRFAAFMLLYFFLLSLVTFVLPRPWFLWCFRTLFPFMPERLDEDSHKYESKTVRRKESEKERW